MPQIRSPRTAQAQYAIRADETRCPTAAVRLARPQRRCHCERSAGSRNSSAGAEAAVAAFNDVARDGGRLPSRARFDKRRTIELLRIGRIDAGTAGPSADDHRRAVTGCASLPYRKQAPIGANVPAPIHQRGRCERVFPDPVCAQKLEHRTIAHDECLALIVREEDLAVDRDRGCRKPLTLRDAQPSLPERLFLSPLRTPWQCWPCRSPCRDDRLR